MPFNPRAVVTTGRPFDLNNGAVIESLECSTQATSQKNSQAGSTNNEHGVNDFGCNACALEQWCNKDALGIVVFLEFIVTDWTCEL